MRGVQLKYDQSTILFFPSKLMTHGPSGMKDFGGVGVGSEEMKRTDY
jgi:hypothetical protein